MAWAYFQNQAAFDAYANAVCTDQAIPKAGYRQSDQTTQVQHRWTDAWVEPIQIKDQGNVTTWAAHIPDAHVTQYAAFLGIAVADSQVVFNGDGTVTITGVAPQPRTYVLELNTLTYKKAKPSTWTDKYGVTWNTTTGDVVSTTTTTVVIANGKKH